MKHKCSILVVEDELITRKMLVEYFQDQDYIVYDATESRAAQTILANNDIDLVLLDIKLADSDLDGLQLTLFIRSTYDIGVILVTSVVDKTDCIVGLEIGADDYVTKPFNPRELLARVKNTLRHYDFKEGARRNKILHQHRKVINERKYFKSWYVVEKEYRLYDPDNNEVKLTGAEFTLLTLLVNSHGRVMARDYLTAEIQSHEWAPSDRKIDMLVTRLRRKLGDSIQTPTFIRSVRGVGYQFLPDVTVTTDDLQIVEIE